MNPVHIFGFTPPGPRPGQKYVPFLMAFKLEDGNVELHVRNSEGVTNKIAISTSEAMQLSLALGAAKFAHSVVAARANGVNVKINGEAHKLPYAPISYERLVELAGKRGAPSMTVSFGDRDRAGKAPLPGDVVLLDEGAHVTVVHTGCA